MSPWTIFIPSHFIHSSLRIVHMSHYAIHHVLLKCSGIIPFHFLCVFNIVLLLSSLIRLLYLPRWMYVFVTCSHLGDSVRRSIETVLDILFSSVDTVCGWMLSTLYRADPWQCSSLYWRFANSLEASDAIAASRVPFCRQSTNT